MVAEFILTVCRTWQQRLREVSLAYIWGYLPHCCWYYWSSWGGCAAAWWLHPGRFWAELPAAWWTLGYWAQTARWEPPGLPIGHSRHRRAWHKWGEWTQSSAMYRVLCRSWNTNTLKESVLGLQTRWFFKRGNQWNTIKVVHVINENVAILYW